MLLRGLTLLVLMQLLGTAINVLLLPMIPGQVIGMLLLFALLILQGEVSPPLSEAAKVLMRFFAGVSSIARISCWRTSKDG